MQRKFLSSVRIFYPRFNRQELVQIIQDKLGELEKKLPLLVVVLFGSYARGNYTVGSDVDLLVIYKGGRKADAFKVVKRILAIPLLEPHIYSEDEYREMKERIDRMIKGGIVLSRKMS